MAYPRFNSPADFPTQEQVRLPAVSVIEAGGYLAQSAPVVRFGTVKNAACFLLLSYDQRMAVSGCIPDFGDISDRLPGDMDRFAVLRPSGERGRWANAEPLWVAVPYINVLSRMTKHNTHNSRLIFELARITG